LCVALWEALDGGRLFGERTPATALAAGDVLPRPRNTPRWLWQRLRRGLDPRPNRRFAGTSTLARALSPPRRTPAFVLGAAAVSATLFAATWPQPATCMETVDARLNRMWPLADRAALRETMAQQREAAAADMDAYVERWVSASVELCQTSREEQALVPTRDAAACLGDRLQAAIALTREFARPDVDANRVAQAIGSLPDIDGCTAVTTGLIPLALQLAGDVDAVRRQLAQVHARTVAGRGHAAMALLDRVRVRVDGIGLPWLSSRAALAEGQLLHELGRYDDAVAVLKRSFMVGHGDPALTARTGLGLIMIFGTRLLDADAALQWSRHVEAAIARLEVPDPSLEQKWLRMTGVSLMVAGRYDEALDWLQRAVDLARTQSGGERDRAGAESNLGSLLMRMDRPADALEHFDAALELALSNAKPGDALIADSLLNRGTALESLGRHEEARQTTERALALHVEHRGSHHPSVAGVRQSLGTTLLNLGRIDEAIDQFVAAETVSATALGPDHPDVAFAAASLAGALISAGQPAAARRAATRAVSITEAAQGPEHPMMVYRLLAAAEAAHHDDDDGAAVQLAQRADGLATKVYPAEHEVRVAAAEMLASLRASAGTNAPLP
ncbi:MAG: tetratricopeptide repeat protein, partial [Myxococcota bacterium]